MSLAPPPEAIYPDTATAITAIQEHAKAHGYALFRRDKKASRELWACDRAGKYNPKGKGAAHLSKQRASTGSKKCDCLMRVELRLDSISTTWSLRVLEKSHNHTPSSAITAHPAYRIAAISSDTRSIINNMSRSGLSPAQILSTLRNSDPDVPLIPKDIANITQQARLEELGGKTPIQWLLDVRPCPIPSLLVLITSIGASKH
jgi:hypothetical protein